MHPAYFPTLNLCFVIEQSPEHRKGEVEVYAEVNNLVRSILPNLSWVLFIYFNPCCLWTSQQHVQQENPEMAPRYSVLYPKVWKRKLMLHHLLIMTGK